MNLQEQVRPQKLTCVQDLELLIRGDVVKVVYETMDSYTTIREKFQAAFHGNTIFNQLLFVRPMSSPKGESILLHKVHLRQVDSEGRLYIIGYGSVNKGFTKRDKEYNEYNKTLIMGGLRQA